MAYVVMVTKELLMQESGQESEAINGVLRNGNMSV